MARPASITQEDVENAVTALEDNGKPITLIKSESS